MNNCMDTLQQRYTLTQNREFLSSTYKLLIYYKSGHVIMWIAPLTLFSRNVQGLRQFVAWNISSLSILYATSQKIPAYLFSVIAF